MNLPESDYLLFFLFFPIKIYEKILKIVDTENIHNIIQQEDCYQQAKQHVTLQNFADKSIEDFAVYLLCQLTLCAFQQASSFFWVMLGTIREEEA